MNTLPLPIRQRLDKLTDERVTKSRYRRKYYTQSVIQALDMCPHARNVRLQVNIGLVRFNYGGRAVRYYIGTCKLVVQSGSRYTTYNDLHPTEFIEMCESADTTNSFTL